MDNHNKNNPSKETLKIQIAGVIEALKKKGFVQKGKDPLPLIYGKNPKIKLNLTIHSNPLIQDDKERIAEQLRINVPFFIDMVSCTKNQADYDAEIKTWLHNNRAPR